MTPESTLQSSSSRSMSAAFVRKGRRALSKKKSLKVILAVSLRLKKVVDFYTYSFTDTLVKYNLLSIKCIVKSIKGTNADRISYTVNRFAAIPAVEIL